VKKKQRKALGAYVRYIANELNLRDWTIHICHAPAEEGRAGGCRCTDGMREATLWFGWNFCDLDAEEQRETVVHELLHIHHDGCWKMVQTDLAEALGAPTYHVFCDSYRRSMEFMIDALAKAIAPKLPLIDWSSK
jgi:hypothetical protein